MGPTGPTGPNVALTGFSAQRSATSTGASTQLGGWTVTSPYYTGTGFNATTGSYTVPITGRYSIKAIISYSTTAAISVQLKLKPDTNQWSFSYPAYSTWYPHIQLCVCYDRTKKYAKAYEHNEKARAYRPKDPSVLHNKSYLEKTYGFGSEENQED